jgi:hypothetical protein
MGAAGLAAGGAQAISGAFKSPYEKQQEEDLRKMKEQQARGMRGTSEAERSRMHMRETAPAVKQMENARKRQEALAAATGQTSSAQMQQLNQAQQVGTGQVMQESAIQQRQADEQKRAQQEAREQQTAAAIEAARKDRRKAVLSGIGQMVGAAGMIAGSVPEATRAADVAGAPIRDPDALVEYLRSQGISEEAVQKLAKMDPNVMTRALDQAAKGDLASEEAAMMDAILREDMYRQAETNVMANQSSRRGSMAELSRDTEDDYWNEYWTTR